MYSNQKMYYLPPSTVKYLPMVDRGRHYIKLKQCIRTKKLILYYIPQKCANI